MLLFFNSYVFRWRQNKYLVYVHVNQQGDAGSRGMKGTSGKPGERVSNITVWLVYSEGGKKGQKSLNKMVHFL